MQISVAIPGGETPRDPAPQAHGITLTAHYNCCIDWAMKEVLDNQDLGIQLTSLPDRLTDLDYADDIAILAKTSQELQLMVDRVAAAASRLGLCINSAKLR